MKPAVPRLSHSENLVWPILSFTALCFLLSVVDVFAITSPCLIAITATFLSSSCFLHVALREHCVDDGDLLVTDKYRSVRRGVATPVLIRLQNLFSSVLVLRMKNVSSDQVRAVLHRTQVLFSVITVALLAEVSKQTTEKS